MKLPILCAQNLKKTFNDHVVLHDLSFELYKGECLGLLGGSGSGKSVTLRSLIGLERIDQGQIRFHAERIDNLSEAELNKIRTQISYSFQSGALFDSMNVFENIAYPLYEHTNMNYPEIQNRVAEILNLVDLQGIENYMPSDLSGGMQKRVGMARAMVLNPQVVLYDEPTAGLDPVNTKNVVALMKKLKEIESTSIFVTHDIPSALELCNRLIILHLGTIVFEGTPQEFIHSEDPVVIRFAQAAHYHHPHERITL